MKVVILAGGFGTRISEESAYKPKPMIEIGGKPILWHIMKEYSFYGFNEFIICAGYKQHIIKEWFADYFLHNSDITFDFTENGKMIVIRLSEQNGKRGAIKLGGKVKLLNMLEDVIGETDTVEYKPFEIITIGIET